MSLPEALSAWRPTMQEYLADSAISSGFLKTAMYSGLSTALWERGQGYSRPTTEPALAKGTALHAWLSKDATASIAFVPGTQQRRGKQWAAHLHMAKILGADVLLTEKAYRECEGAWQSLCSGDTPKKKEIGAMYSTWASWPEVSHRWQPLDRQGVPINGAMCKIRQDIVACSTTGVWVSGQIKTTTAAGLTERSWWPFWRRNYLKSAAFYRAGMRDLFGETPFRDLYIVARLAPPFPWTFYDLQERTAELDEVWYDELVPEIALISESMSKGQTYGSEERGMF